MAFKFKVTKPRLDINLPSRPQLSIDDGEDALIGEINGFKASAGEERLANALKRSGIGFYFRYTVGAPRGLPGWKEVDFIVHHRGLVYAVEVDSAFTHRTKQNADVLHDAIILNDRELNMIGQVYPRVFHVDGEQDLADKNSAKSYVKRTFN